ncbi:MAG: DoxX family protein [Actinomycetota bacterium]|nr:DoxX family protein [Actinomycetota bacterium]
MACERAERRERWRRRTPWIVAAAFTLSGVIHLVHPATFTRIVPDPLPAKTALVYLSGVAELICAAGLWRRDRWAGIAAAVLLVAIWPANLQMAISAQDGHVLATKVEDWIRFPLQIPLIWFALQARRPATRPPHTRSPRAVS